MKRKGFSQQFLFRPAQVQCSCSMAIHYSLGCDSQDRVLGGPSCYCSRIKPHTIVLKTLKLN